MTTSPSLGSSCLSKERRSLRLSMSFSLAPVVSRRLSTGWSCKPEGVFIVAWKNRWRSWPRDCTCNEHKYSIYISMVWQWFPNFWHVTRRVNRHFTYAQAMLVKIQVSKLPVDALRRMLCAPLIVNCSRSSNLQPSNASRSSNLQPLPIEVFRRPAGARVFGAGAGAWGWMISPLHTLQVCFVWLLASRPHASSLVDVRLSTVVNSWCSILWLDRHSAGFPRSTFTASSKSVVTFSSLSTVILSSASAAPSLAKYTKKHVTERRMMAAVGLAIVTWWIKSSCIVIRPGQLLVDEDVVMQHRFTSAESLLG